MYCANCGQQIDGGSKFCRHCGAVQAEQLCSEVSPAGPTDSEVSSGLADNPVVQDGHERPDHKKRKSGCVWAFSVLAILLIVGIIASPNPNSTTESNASIGQNTSTAIAGESVITSPLGSGPIDLRGAI